MQRETDYRRLRIDGPREVRPRDGALTPGDASSRRDRTPAPYAWVGARTGPGTAPKLGCGDENPYPGQAHTGIVTADCPFRTGFSPYIHMMRKLHDRSRSEADAVIVGRESEVLEEGACLGH